MPSDAIVVINPNSTQSVTDGIRDAIGADSLAYLSQEGMMRAVVAEAASESNSGHCSACFTGEYPIELGTYWEDRDKLAFQGAWSETGDGE